MEITRNGVPVAIIEPARPNPLRGLIESGELRPATGSLPLLPADALLAPDTAGVDAILDDRYGDGRWSSLVMR